MSDQPTKTTNIDGYDNPPIEWDAVRDVISVELPQAPGTGGPNRHTAWLATIDPDGKPHVRAVGIMWCEGRIVFTSSLQARKGKNLLADPRCSLSIATEPFDIVLEGRATLIPPEGLPAVVDVFAPDWPVEIDGSGEALTAPFNAQSAGPPPYHAFELTIEHANALGTVEDVGGATSWDF